ncbi:hypothetical protein GH714_037265 [Hevea brasiliensis]|uniref:U-box domain-containing protein n=1 Tax=Hevea brasiliensis TaxID=3981 RepID=A0A6A6L4I0_HEVBR|nr:hypothetical protein GH714_037265 [Hevea brasiliensis]
MASHNEKNRKNRGFIDFVKVREVLSSIGLRSPSAYDEEILKLEAEAEKQAGTGGLIVSWERSNSKKKLYDEKAIDHISAIKAATDAVKMTAEFLVGKLAMGSLEIQRQAAYELRLLAKTGMDNRRIIAEAGAIPFLVTLLSSTDPRIQENAVTALLNLSIYDNNKSLIMAARAIDSIINVLESGKTMESRENAAAAIFSLSMINDCKVTIGARPRAIPALVRLIREGTTAGKRDAASALFNLAVCHANKASVVVAGAVPLLIELLVDDKAGITDDALTVLSLLISCPEGLEEIRNSRVLVPLLIDLLRFGSAKGKENSITLLLGLCKDGGEEVARRLLMNPRSIPSLQSLSVDGSLKARRKADALLRLLNSVGTNDLVDNFYELPTRKLQFSISGYQDFLLHELESAIQRLHNAGGRRFVVVGLPPIGCLPVQVTLGSLMPGQQMLQRLCVEQENTDSIAYNKKLRTLTSWLEGSWPNGAKVAYLDIYDPMKDMVNNPAKYGLNKHLKDVVGWG